LSSEPVDTRADRIRIVGINRRGSFHGIIKDQIHRVTRLDVARGITEATQQYVANRIQEELAGRAPNTVQDIEDLKNTVKHLTTIIQKNTSVRITSKTNEQDRIDFVIDQQILGSISPPLSPISRDIFGVIKMVATKVGGDEWYSTSWGNGVSRNVGDEEVDPEDSRVTVAVGTPGTTELNFDGVGNLKLNEANDNVEIWIRCNNINFDWRNTEVTIFFRREPEDVGAGEEIRIISRSNHRKVYTGQTPSDCGFGGYYATWSGSDQTTDIQVESVHPVFSDKLNVEDYSQGFSGTSWYGMKMITRDDLNQGVVRVEMWWCKGDSLNIRGEPEGWTKQNEFTFNGSNVEIDPTGNETRVSDCTGKGSSTASDLEGKGTKFYQLGGQHCAIQFVDLNKFRAKWVSVREVDPIGVLPSTGTGNKDIFGILMLNPTKSAGTTWFSTAWGNGIFREIDEGDFDPHDSRFQYLNGDPDTTPLRVLGNGEVEIDEQNSSNRMCVVDTWLNTEMTIYQYVDPSDDSFHDITARSRSRHETACSFGNYLVMWRDTRGDFGNTVPQMPSETNVSVEVEAMHPHYVRDLDQKNWSPGIIRGIWIGFKQVTRTRTSDGHVIVEGYVNYNILNQTEASWTKTNEYDFAGTNPTVPSAWASDSSIDACIGLGDLQANKMDSGDEQAFRYTGTGNRVWWRINGMSKCKWKYASVREIDPLP
jgi:hypothetical protein